MFIPHLSIITLIAVILAKVTLKFALFFPPMVGTGLSGGGGGSPVTRYFGACDQTTGAVAASSASNSDATLTMWVKYTCPGTGTQTAQAMAAYIDKSGTTKVKYAIYTAAGALVAETAALTLAAGQQWQEIAISASLTGGASYYLCVSVDAGGLSTTFCDLSKTAPDANFNFSQYTVSAYPGTLPTGVETNGTAITAYTLRCKVFGT